MKRNVLSSRVRRALGMTLVETLISALAVVTTFAILSAVSASLRDDDALARTQNTLAMLQNALRQYPQPLPDDTALVLQRLLKHPSTHTILTGLTTSTSQGEIFVEDAYGHRLVYQPGSTLQSAGEFISPGADGQLGDAFSQDPATRRAAADNLHGSDTEDFLP